MLRQLSEKIFRKKRRADRLSLEVRPDGLAWCHWAGKQYTHDFLECSPARRQEKLEELVASQNWRNIPTQLVLPIDQYQVFQIERPAGVEDAELADALRWKLKDLLDYSPADAVCDVFPFPADASRGRGDLVNVVVARKVVVLELIKLVDSAGLVLEKIDIAELALGNLGAFLDDAGNGVAVVHLRDNYGQMAICKGGALYLSRRLEVSSESLKDAGQQENAIQGLALEMQRSLDYFESQLGQIPPRRIELIARDAVTPLAPMLSSYVAIPIAALDWNSAGLEEPLDSRCLPAWSQLLASRESAA